MADEKITGSIEVAAVSATDPASYKTPGKSVLVASSSTKAEFQGKEGQLATFVVNEYTFTPKADLAGRLIWDSVNKKHYAHDGSTLIAMATESYADAAGATAAANEIDNRAVLAALVALDPPADDVARTVKLTKSSVGGGITASLA